MTGKRREGVSEPSGFRLLVTFHPDIGIQEGRRELQKIRETGFDGVRTFTPQHMELCRELGLVQLTELYFSEHLERVGPDGWARRVNGGLGRIPYRDHTYCAGNPLIAEAGEAGVREEIRKYRDSPVPIAFQIDNEFSYLDLEDTTQYLCYCPTCSANYRAFLRERFGDVSRLNRSWGARYSSWDEISPPIKQYRRPWRRKEELPAWVEFRRFTNQAIARYIRGLSKAAREETDKPIVIAEMNTMFFDGCVHAAQDLYSMSREADVLGLNIGGCEFAEIVDFTRGFGRELWLTESHIETAILNSRLMRQRHYSAIAHGCRSVNFFKSRASMEGIERDMFGITFEDGSPVQLFYEVAQITRELKRLAPELGRVRHYKPKAAIVYSWETMFVNDYLERTLGGRGTEMTAISALHGAYRATRALHLPVEAVTTDQMAEESLEKHEAMILPACVAFPKALAGRLVDWMREGGTLVVEYPFSRYDEGGMRNPREPGEEWEALGIETVPFGFGRHDLATASGVFPAVGERGRIVRHSGEVLGKFSDGEPAIVRITVGKGQCVFCAASPSIGMKNFASSLYPDFIGQFLPAPPVRLGVPPAIGREIDMGLLLSEDGALLVLVNYNEAVVREVPVKVSVAELPGGGREVWMHDQALEERSKLASHGSGGEGRGEKGEFLHFTIRELDTTRVIELK